MEAKREPGPAASVGSAKAMCAAMASTLPVQMSLVTAVGAGIIAFTKRNKHVSRVSTAGDQIANQVNHG
jgi:hypothetical protein